MAYAKTDWPADLEVLWSAREVLSDVAVSAHLDIGEAEAAWRGVERHAVGSPFQRLDFYTAWMQTLGAREGAEPLVLVGRKAGRVAMVLPLVVRRTGPFRVAEFAGGSHANFNIGLFDRDLWPTIGRGLAVNVLEAISDARPDIDYLRLAYQPIELAGRRNPFVDSRSRPAPHPTFDVFLTGGFEAVLSRHRGSKKRKRLRADLRNFDAVGGAVVRQAASETEAHDILEAFLDQKGQRLAEQGLPNVFAVQGTPEFLHDLVARSYSGSGEPLVEAYALWAGGEIRATGITLPFGGAAYFLMNSFANDAFARASPGEITLHHMIGDYAGRGFDAFDFGIGDARYKRSWCDREVMLAETVLPLSAAGTVAVGYQSLKRRTRDYVVSNPRLHAFAQRLRRGRNENDEAGGEADED